MTATTTGPAPASEQDVELVRELATRARAAARQLALLTRAEKDSALLALAESVVTRAG